MLRVKKLKAPLVVLSVLFSSFSVACLIDASPSNTDPVFSEVSDSQAVEANEDKQWRRTLHGWQRISDWESPLKPASIYPRYDWGVVHPTLVGIMQLLLSVGALILFSHSPKV